MANTYTLIEAKTLGSSAASIEFTSIPQTYTDLVLVYSARTNAAGRTDEANLTFNSNTSNYSWKMLYGSGTAAESVQDSSATSIAGIQIPGGGSTASTFSNGQIYIPNYTGSNNKSVSSEATQEDNQALAYIKVVSGLWSNSAAITSVKLSGATGSFVQHSTAYLYGISNS
jgi:hypothetical protein